MLENTTHKTFESLIGETLSLKTGDMNFQADIESVNLFEQNPGQERQSFSVILQAHDAHNHGQKVYQLSHPALGKLDLFLVPIGPGEKGMRYEIIFN